MTPNRQRVSMWALMIVLAIGVNFVVANVALAACQSSGQCYMCVAQYCENHGGFRNYNWLGGGECLGQCQDEPEEWFDCVCVFT